MKKTKMNTAEFIPFSKFKKEILKDPDVKKAYEALDFEYKIIGALIKARAKHHLTQRELAAKIGVTQSALARFESGKINPTLAFVQKVTEGLGLKIIVK